MFKHRAIHHKSMSIVPVQGIYKAPSWQSAEVYPSHEQQT